VSHALHVRNVAEFSAVNRSVRAALWLEPESKALWNNLFIHRFGHRAAEASQRARPGVEGPALYRTARALTLYFRDHLEIVMGSVVDHAVGVEVVACPVTRTLQHFGFGAQFAVRRAAGKPLEDAIDTIETPVDELSVTLVPGGPLAHRVALTVTEPPANLMERFFFSAEVMDPRQPAMVAYVRTLHDNLVRVVREAGLRRLAMPTLCTGGVRLPPALVAVAAIRAVHEDFCQHPADALRVRVACFERGHAPAFEEVRDELIRHFFAPDKAERSLMPSAFPAQNESREGE